MSRNGLIKLKGQKAADRIMDMMFDQMDYDRDGQISFSEFGKKLGRVELSSSSRFR